MLSSWSATNPDNPSLEGTRGPDFECRVKIGLEAADDDVPDGREDVSTPAASTFAVGFRSRPEERACAGGGDGGGGGGMTTEGVTNADADELDVRLFWLGGGVRSCVALDGVDGGFGCSSARASEVGTELFGGAKLLSFKVAGSFQVILLREPPAESWLIPKAEGLSWTPPGTAWLRDARRSSGLAFNNCPRTLSMPRWMISSSLNTSMKLKKEPSSGFP